MGSDPAFSREQRRALAKAAAAAWAERIDELRAKHLASRATTGHAASTRPRVRSKHGEASRTIASRTIEGAAIAPIARRILDEHPHTWTSYAELCSASGLDPQLALIAA